jgi:hypothetical protein
LISRNEIEEKGKEFGIHVANVQRDYVFGWLLVAIFNDTDLAVSRRGPTLAGITVRP